MSLVTILPAPITAPVPILTPPKMITFSPIRTSWSIFVFLYGENRKYLYKVLNLQKVNCLLFPNLNDVIECIFSLKLERKLILFSPASPSFDQYLNFEERGKSFKELIKKSVII